MVRDKSLKHIHKRQNQVWEKDEEELQLEQSLFGQRKKRKVAVKKGDEADGSDQVDIGMRDAEDEDLFMVDAPIASGSGAGSDSEDDESDKPNISDDDASASEDEDKADSGGDVDDSESGGDDEDEDEELEDGESGEDEVDITMPEDQYDIADEADRKPAEFKARTKPCVWQDPSDELIGLDLSEIRRLKKLARGKPNSKVGGAELEKRLREQFERIHPRPDWATGRIRTGVPSLSSLFSSTKSFIDSSAPIAGSSRSPLPQGTIEMQRLRNANQANPTTGKKEAQGGGSGVVDFVWHPSARVPVGVVCGGDRRIRFFNIDGHANPTLLTLHIPALPLTKTTFHPTGSSLLITGTRPYYYTYDLASQKCLRSPRNLFGSNPSASAPQALTTHSFSPDGSLLAVAGRRGAVSILDWSTSGTGAVVAEFKGGRGGKTADIIWGADGKELEILGGRDGAEVEVWDVGSRRIVRKWSDDRAFGGEILRRSKGGEYTAIGSSTGIINLYSTSSTTQSRTKSQDPSTLPILKPEPVKSLEHLTTSICAVDFHPSGEMMVGASTGKRDALKLYHLPSATAYSNWPTKTTSLGRVTTAAFSTSGEYLAVGNQKGNILLWSLKHFSR